MFRKSFTAAFCAASLVLFFSCGGGENPESPVDEITAEAWALFEQGAFGEAAARFGDAIQQDPQWADAYNGRGWCLLELRELEASSEDFYRAIQLSQSSDQVAHEARTGRGSVLNALREHRDAVEATMTVIEEDPSFRFSHRESIDIVDVRLIQSTALLGLALGEQSPSVVDSLFDDVAGNLNAIDTENTVSREDPSTWRVGEKRYISFEETILEKLEWLISVYFG